jgi:DNA-binding GntR family transcriptional regulator
MIPVDGHKVSEQQRPIITDFYRSVLTEALRLHRICFSAHPYNDPDIKTHLAETARQHRVIFDAISKQDVKTADKLAVEHHKLSRSRLDTLISRQSQSLKEELEI